MLASLKESWRKWKERRKNAWYETVATPILIAECGLTETDAKAATRDERVRACIDSILAINADEWKYHASRKMRELRQLTSQV